MCRRRLKARGKGVGCGMKLVRLLQALSLGILISVPAKAVPLLSVVSTQGVPGSTATIAINYASNTNITGLNFDLLYNTNYLQLGAVTQGNPLPGGIYGTNLIAPGQFRVLVLSGFGTFLSNGPVVYMPFTIATNSPDHEEPLVFTNVAATDAAGVGMALPTTNGVLSVIVPPRVSIKLTSGGIRQLAFSASTNRSYAVQSATNLAAPQWLAFTNVISGSDPVFDDMTATNFPVRFYRVLVAP